MNMKKDFFQEMGFEINGIRHLSAREAFAAISKGAFLVDVRKEDQVLMKTFKVENYIICPLELLDENIESFPKEKPLIVSDATGLHSKEAVTKLINAGFMVANLAGGIMDWEQDGFPVNKDPNEQMSGQCPCMLKPMGKIKNKSK
jgi:rhodanese-related sulfurtransferase